MLHCPTCGQDYADDVKACPEDGAPLRADETVAEQRPVDPLLGLTLDGKYRLVERLGKGGMGTVYRATHLLIDRPVAIKVLNPHFVEDEEAQERFRREARAAGRLQHQNVAAVTDFGRTEDGLVYIVMELLEGRSLRDVLAREAPLDAARAVSLMLQISAAVAAAHEAKVIHRDLKPGNIFVVQRKHAPPVVKVLDFGIAKLAADAIEDDEEHEQTLTKVGVMIGTPRYMSPEQCDGGKLTPASDVYSLGIILYEMLTGTTPFSGSTALAIAMKHSSETPRPPREFVSTIPPQLEDVVLHALEKQPGNRPSDAGAFRRELYAMAERLGLEHAGGHTAPTMESLRGAGTETPSGRLIVDMVRVREHRAAITSGEIMRGADISKEYPAPAAAQAEPAVAAMAADTASNESPATAALLIPGETAPSRIRMIFERPEIWLRWLRNPVVLTCICLAVLMLAVVIFAIVQTRSSGKTKPATNSTAGAEAANVPVVGATTLRADPSPSPDPESASANASRAQPARSASGGPRRRSSPTAQRQQQRQPQKGAGFFNKIKRAIKKPF
ncbi:MAG TPA: serine/threonine-protein kinase [Pyrinomonadaceae bacterium]|jgi:serine/threonine-protein kinase|nr:serine/threonine-protein kinase [Pyrinomonadaceae bacterium]